MDEYSKKFRAVNIKPTISEINLYHKKIFSESPRMGAGRAIGAEAAAPARPLEPRGVGPYCEPIALL
jgi:hypothetical protein